MVHNLLLTNEGLGEAIQPLLQSAGQATLKHFRTQLSVDNKAVPGQFDPVTEADKLCETIIRDGLAKQFPDHRIVGEEFGGELGEGMTWVIDPIDGTRSFMSGMLHWGLLLGLYDGLEPIFGAMYQPFTNELWIGDGRSARYQRGEFQQPITVSPCEELALATLATTTPEMFKSTAELAAFDSVRQAARQVRYGGDCYLYSLIAMGHIDLGVEASLQPYDIAALIPIIRGAGGVVTGWRGESPALGGRILAAGDARVHEAALGMLSTVD